MSKTINKIYKFHNKKFKKRNNCILFHLKGVRTLLKEVLMGGKKLIVITRRAYSRSSSTSHRKPS